MTRTDHQIIFTAMSFLAVVLQKVPLDEQAARAKALARLIEGFCINSVTGAFEGEGPLYVCATSEINKLLTDYLTALRDGGEASLEYERDVLLKIYEQLQIQLGRRQQKEFYALATDEMIAARIVQMAEETIRYDEEAA